MPLRRVVFAVCSLLLVLGASACGGSNSGDSKKPSAENPLAAAAGRTASTGTARVAAVARGSLDDTAYTHRRVGVVDFEHGYVSVTQRSTIAGETLPPTRHVELDGYLYDQVASRWVKEKEGDGQSSAAGDATRLVDYLQGWSSGVAVARRSGRAVVYRAKLDLRAAIEDDLQRHRWTDSAIGIYLGNQAPRPAAVEATVGQDGLIHHVVVRGGVNGETTTLDLSNFGLRVNAQPPT